MKIVYWHQEVYAQTFPERRPPDIKSLQKLTERFCRIAANQKTLKRKRSLNEEHQ